MFLLLLHFSPLLVEIASAQRIGQGSHLLFGFALLSAGFMPYCRCAYFVEPIKRISVFAPRRRSCFAIPLAPFY